MPIRMVEDENTGSQDNSGGFSGNNKRSSGGGGGGFGGILGAILPLLLRNPKLLVVAIVVGGIYWFFAGSGSIFSSGSANNLATGAEMKQEVFDQAEVFEPLYPETNTLPERVSLEQFCPKRLNQGSQGSCVAWSSGYAARTILESQAKKINPNDVRFSPSFLYNQIKLDGCQGSYVVRAMENMMQVGSLPFSQFAYDEESCEKEPNNYEKQQAARYKMKGFNRLTKSGDDYDIDFVGMKQNLTQGAPCVIGMMVGGSFMQDMMGQKVWIPQADDYDMSGFGGHAMCVIGYDDYLEGGAFQIMNSWGEEWGENGIAWVKYKDFAHFVREAYAVYPLSQQQKGEVSTFAVEIALINNSSKQAIGFNQIKNNVFNTEKQISKGDKFKIALKNDIECYTYVFGQETDGSSYVLFPYTKKHSSYCGITGTRLFPKDYSMQADNLGNKDFMAIVVSKQPLDYTKLNQAINASKKASYAEKVNEILASEMADVRFSADGAIRFEGKSDGKNTVAVILQIDKK
ncbi:MAG: peptidase C1 [Bacteroidetes bacterium]|nr:MAG: peptidase C1 [Bacteroidota bacterium]